MKMTQNEIVSLLKLLEDPDNKVFEAVKEKIKQDSEFFKIYLENYHSLSNNLLAIQRSEEILDEIFLQKFFEDLKNFLTDENSHLSQGAFLFETYFNRDLDKNQIEAYFDEVLRAVWIEINDNLTAFEKINILKEVIFNKQKFKKTPLLSNQLEMFNVATCLSHKKLTPVTAAMLYSMLCEQLKIPFYPLNFPSLSIIGFYNKEFEMLPNPDIHKGIMFCIFPYMDAQPIGIPNVKKMLKDLSPDYDVDRLSTMPYKEYLLEYFKMRIDFLKKNEIDNFATKNSNRVIKFYEQNYNVKNI
jgi:hypothetical protein